MDKNNSFVSLFLLAGMGLGVAIGFAVGRLYGNTGHVPCALVYHLE